MSVAVREGVAVPVMGSVIVGEESGISVSRESAGTHAGSKMPPIKTHRKTVNLIFDMLGLYQRRICASNAGECTDPVKNLQNHLTQIIDLNQQVGYNNKLRAEVAELADAHDSNSCALGHVGSIPTFGTFQQKSSSCMVSFFCFPNPFPSEQVPGRASLLIKSLILIRLQMCNGDAVSALCPNPSSNVQR